MDDGLSVAANRTQGWRAVGGRLTLSDGRLRFRPHALERMLRSQPVDVPLDTVRHVGIEPHRRGDLGETYTGGWRDRLRIELADGTVHLFVVSEVTAVAARIAMLADAV